MGVVGGRFSGWRFGGFVAGFFLGVVGVRNFGVFARGFREMRCLEVVF
jgi:hypothetical protein